MQAATVAAAAAASTSVRFPAMGSRADDRLCGKRAAIQAGFEDDDEAVRKVAASRKESSAANIVM